MTTPPAKDELLERLISLHKQATVECSHFYVGKCAADAIERITRLTVERDAALQLAMRQANQIRQLAAAEMRKRS